MSSALTSRTLFSAQSSSWASTVRLPDVIATTYWRLGLLRERVSRLIILPMSDEERAESPALARERGERDPANPSDSEGEGENINPDRPHGDDDSSEEEEEDEEAARQVADGFIVDEDEDEEEERRRRHRERKRKKRREEEDEALDEDDLDLVAEATGHPRKDAVCSAILLREIESDACTQHKMKRFRRGSREPSSRPTDLARIFDDDDDDDDEGEEEEVPNIADAINAGMNTSARTGDTSRPVEYADEDDMDDFIDDDDDDIEGLDEDEREARRQELKEQKRRQKAAGRALGMDPAKVGFDRESWEVIHDVFGRGDDYDWALEPEDEELEEDRPKNKVSFKDVRISFIVEHGARN